MDQEAQRKIMEFQMLEEERKKLEEQLQAIAQQDQNFKSLKENLEQLGDHKGEILASLGGGVFVKSTLQNSDKVLVNIGTGIIIEKDTKEAQKIIDRQVNKLGEVKEEIDKAVQQNLTSLIKLESELRNIALVNVQKNQAKENGEKNSRAN